MNEYSISQLATYLFVRNGQYIAGATLSSVRLNMNQFWAVVSQDFYEFQRYFPLTKKFNIQCNVVGGGVQYDFTQDPNNAGYNCSVLDSPNFGNPPEWISKVVPVGSNQMIANWAAWRRSGQFFGQPGKLVTPRMVLNDYRKPVLRITEGGTFDVTCHYNRFCNIALAEDGTTITDVTISDFDPTKMNLFLDLCSGRFLEVVGRNRRAFTYQDLPITVDADKLVQEGSEIIKTAKENIYLTHEWNRSIHL